MITIDELAELRRQDSPEDELYGDCSWDNEHSDGGWIDYYGACIDEWMHDEPDDTDRYVIDR